MSMPETEPADLPTLDLGLVMAGAVSAGAYTGGAIDFLLQALEAWSAAKADGAGPPYAVTIKVVTGASAGGMTAAMFATALAEPVPPVTLATPAASRGANKFYDAWVRQISIEKLLQGRDLAQGTERVVSALDCTVLDEIAKGLIRPGPTKLAAPRPYVADPLVVALTVTNLRGVPYEVQFQGLGGTHIPYGMTLHADDVTFAVTGGGPPAPVVGLEASITTADHAVPLDARTVGGTNWPMLADAALATGAFPFGLAPRTLSRPAGDYANREWRHPFVAYDGDRNAVVSYFRRRPHAMPVRPDYPYRFACVDGGVIDNEPMGIARDHLDWNRPEIGPRPSAILMIDPFPNENSFVDPYDFPDRFNLLKLAMPLIGALIAQSRFKPEELTRAADPTVFNQFMLNPTRRRPGLAKPEKHPIACGGLGGFAGFLSEDFRRHDYFLGRQNMQAFLRRHFVLPESDPLFAQWTDENQKRPLRVRRDAQHRVVETEDDRSFVYDADGKQQPPEGALTSYLPIVPLSEKLQEPEPTEPWPAFTAAQLADLRARVESRSKLVVERLIAGTEGAAVKFLLRRAWWLKRDQFLDAVLNRVRKELIGQELM